MTQNAASAPYLDAIIRAYLAPTVQERIYLLVLADLLKPRPLLDGLGA